MNKPTFIRHPENPIVQPGEPNWRRAVTMNPAVLQLEDGRFYMYERCAGALRPFICSIGLLESDDGIHFTQVGDQPLITPAMLGSEYGSVQDPRVVTIEGIHYLTVAYRPYSWHSTPTGVGVPESVQGEYPGFDGDESKNQTQSAVFKSNDGLDWEFISFVNSMEIDDRNVILFPEKINGDFAILRRPSEFVTTNAQHQQAPAIRLSYSKDLITWSKPEIVIEPIFEWESNRIGGSTPPIKTDAGWLVFYHGVENIDPNLRRVCYRMSAMLLDINDPQKVLARCPHPLLEPEAYYERVGCYIPNVVFPTAALNVDGILHVYYGCCDTTIGLAMVPLADVLTHVQQFSTHKHEQI